MKEAERGKREGGLGSLELEEPQVERRCGEGKMEMQGLVLSYCSCEFEFVCLGSFIGERTPERLDLRPSLRPVISITTLTCCLMKQRDIDPYACKGSSPTYPNSSPHTHTCGIASYKAVGFGSCMLGWCCHAAKLRCPTTPCLCCYPPHCRSVSLVPSAYYAQLAARRAALISSAVTPTAAAGAAAGTEGDAAPKPPRTETEGGAEAGVGAAGGGDEGEGAAAAPGGVEGEAGGVGLGNVKVHVKLGGTMHYV